MQNPDEPRKEKNLAAGARTPDSTDQVEHATSAPPPVLPARQVQAIVPNIPRVPRNITYSDGPTCVPSLHFSANRGFNVCFLTGGFHAA